MITLSLKALIIDFVQHLVYNRLHFRHVSTTKISFTPEFHSVHVIMAHLHLMKSQFS